MLKLNQNELKAADKLIQLGNIIAAKKILLQNKKKIYHIPNLKKSFVWSESGALTILYPNRKIFYTDNTQFSFFYLTKTLDKYKVITIKENDLLVCGKKWGGFYYFKIYNTNLEYHNTIIHSQVTHTPNFIASDKTTNLLKTTNEKFSKSPSSLFFGGETARNEYIKQIKTNKIFAFFVKRPTGDILKVIGKGEFISANKNSYFAVASITKKPIAHYGATLYWDGKQFKPYFIPKTTMDYFKYESHDKAGYHKLFSVYKNPNTFLNKDYTELELTVKKKTGESVSGASLVKRIAPRMINTTFIPS